MAIEPISFSVPLSVPLQPYLVNINMLMMHFQKRYHVSSIEDFAHTVLGQACLA